MIISISQAQVLQASIESLSDPANDIRVTFLKEGDSGGPCTIIRYSFDVPAGRYALDPVQSPVADPSLRALEATLSAWRSVRIEPTVTGTAISNSVRQPGTPRLDGKANESPSDDLRAIGNRHYPPGPLRDRLIAAGISKLATADRGQPKSQSGTRPARERKQA